MTTGRVYNQSKFEELILYVAEKMQDAPSFGATVLNKVLFFSEYFHYAEHGKPITGADYYRLDYGPAPRQMVPVRDGLIQQGRAVMREKLIGTYKQYRLEPLDEADLEVFSATEIKMVDDVIEMLRKHTATSISNASHTMCGWSVAKDRETIPYESIFLYSGPVTEDDQAKARELAPLASASSS